jgi:sporulation protein YlmC with PRC-barrel domain
VGGGTLFLDLYLLKYTRLSRKIYKYVITTEIKKRGTLKMADTDKKYSRQLLGKRVVSKTGRLFGEVGNIVFESRTGELIQLVLRNHTGFAEGLELEKDNQGNLLVPYSSVMAIGDFVVIAEEEII